MPTRRLCGAITLAATATGCGFMPWVTYGEAPPECEVFEPGTQLEWAGHGTPHQFALIPADDNDTPQLPGRIYVGVAIEDEPLARVWCVVTDGPLAPEDPSFYWGFVRDDWVPPP